MSKKTIIYDDSRVNELLNNVGSFFTGTDDMEGCTFTACPVSYAFMVWSVLPDWFKKDEYLKYFEIMTQKNFQSFQGLTDLEITFNGGEIIIPDKYNTFDITFKDYTGQPIYKMFNKAVEEDKDISNIQLMYIMTRPDYKDTSESIVEFAAYYNEVSIENIEYNVISHKEYDSYTTTVTFNGAMTLGPDVEDHATQYMKHWLAEDEPWIECSMEMPETILKDK